MEVFPGPAGWKEGSISRTSRLERRGSTKPNSPQEPVSQVLPSLNRTTFTMIKSPGYYHNWAEPGMKYIDFVIKVCYDVLAFHFGYGQMTTSKH